MNFIIDPLTKKKVNIFTNKGKLLLKKYTKEYFQTGGVICKICGKWMPWGCISGT